MHNFMKFTIQQEDGGLGFKEPSEYEGKKLTKIFGGSWGFENFAALPNFEFFSTLVTIWQPFNFAHLEKKF